MTATTQSELPLLAHWSTELMRDLRPEYGFLIYKERERSVPALLSIADHWQQRTHLVQGDNRLSFSEFIAAVDTRAAALQMQGVEVGQRVLLLGWNSPDWVVAFWAVMKTGASVALGNAWWGAEEVGHAVSLLKPNLVLLDDNKRIQIPADQPCTSISLPSDMESNQFVAVDVDESDIAVILFTSGSTSLPKAVLLSHRALLAGQQGLMHATGQLHLMAKDFPSDVTLISSPLFHVGSIQILLRSLVAGGTIVFSQGRFDAEEILTLISRERVSRWGCVPTMANRVMNHSNVTTTDLSSLKGINVGGAPVSADLMARIRVFVPSLKISVSTGYGLTEAGGVLTMASGSLAATYPGSSGKPLACVEIRIDCTAEGGNEATGVGEILVRSPTLMSGYLGNDVEGVIDAQGWLHTGDLGRSEDGMLYITGRSKDLIIRGGENIAPGPIELALMAVEGVIEAAVIGLPDADLGEVVAAVVVIGAVDIDAEQLSTHISERLASFCIPSQWQIRTEPLPMNDAGKVDKRLLRSHWLEHPKNSLSGNKEKV